MPHVCSRNFYSPAALSRFFLTTIIGLALDLWTKSLAIHHLDEPGKVVRFIPDWLHFEFTKNEGAVFGIGQGQRWLFIAVSIGAIAFLTYLFSASGRQRLYQIILGMLLAGVLGNMYDRLVFGHVRDMIHGLPGWTWGGTWQIPVLNYPSGAREVFPYIFNVADILLCVGVFFMVVYSFFNKPEGETEKNSDRTPAETIEGKSTQPTR
jgi:lipoprotein signal peptidase